MIERELKRRNMVEKFKTKRAALNQIILDINASSEQKQEARQKLQSLPRN